MILDLKLSDFNVGATSEVHATAILILLIV
jgi:hypothetical protein